jgi:hypothetical protein
MARLRWLEHRGRRILYSDYSGIHDGSQGIAQLDAERAEVVAQSDRVLLLANFSDSTPRPDFIKAAQKYGVEVRKTRVARTAIVGVSGLKGLVVKGYLAVTGEATVKMFGSEPEALDWLAAG